ncbi:MAG: chromosome segregation protein SMC [Deltaproteobacteria bacterium]|nr:chromosome segregation protein SMC [Deltaproteobacteria bacterium]
MKIKKLTIHGFKSFSDRTTFAFHEGVSGIVGPNGCGKSNIVDAIRWVLGEHNARHLRGKHMEDLIFGGSESRKQVGMAEVTLTLANDNGAAPAAYANFSEIEIQRRLYRDGESEYAINKVPSRLKDIVELFTDTGIGTRAYSIIEQGQVGWLVNAKPEERREIFEEAAGINKYKHKKDAALRRLESTQENLTRVTDIIAEVKRQLNSLNRQAKKAERYKILKDELKGLDLFHSHAEFARLSADLTRLASEITAANDKEAALGAEAGAKQSAIDELRLEQTSRENEYRDIREKTSSLERNIQEEERLREIAALRIEEIKRLAERLSGDIEELSTQIHTMKGEFEFVSSEIKSAETIASEEKSLLNAKEAEANDADAKLKAKEDALRSIEATKIELLTKLADAKHALQAVIKEEETLRERSARLTSEIASTARAIEENASPLKMLQGAMSELERRKESIDSGIKTTEERLKSLETARGDNATRLETLRESFATKNARLNALNEMNASMEGVKDGVKSLIHENRTGVHGMIADVIETAPGYERAVEAVLGERLQYVIVQSHREGIEAVDYLKTHASGRASFIPVTEARLSYSNGNGNGNGHALPEGAENLLSRITVKEGYSKIINYLFSNVVVVNTLDRAVDIWRQNGVARTLVTPDGELIDPQGIITGGSTNGSDGGLLYKRREAKELSGEVKATEEALAEAEAGLVRLDKDIVEARTSLEAGRKSLHAEDIDRVNSLGEIKRLENEARRLEERLSSLKAELETTEAGLNAAGSKKSTLSTERESFETGLKNAEGSAIAATEEVLALKTRKDAISIEASDIRVKAAAAIERLEHLRSMAAEKSRLMAESERRIEVKRAEISAGATEAAEKEKETLRHKEALEGLLAKRDELKKDESSREEILNSFNARVKDAEAALKKLTSEINATVAEKSALSLKAREAEMALANMKSNTIERYGVSLAEYAPTEAATAMTPEEMAGRIAELREKIGSMGEVSLGALEEYEELDKRHTFLNEQKEDLEKSIESLRSAITRINRTTRERFQEAFEAINAEFTKNFPRFFNGGKAELVLTGEGDVLECGVEIVASPPGKKLQNITLLSGGEKALTATALIFSIFLIKPSPFCLLDEVDAPLDDANIDRFNGFVKEMSEKSQFILITHNKRTMEIADTLYGITMEEPGVSKTVSVEL